MTELEIKRMILEMANFELKINNLLERVSSLENKLFSLQSKVDLLRDEDGFTVDDGMVCEKGDSIDSIEKEIPREISIGQYNIKVIDVDQDRVYHPMDGVCLMEKEEIQLSVSLSKNIKKTTLCHEILHFLFFSSGVNKLISSGNKYDEEEIICVLDSTFHDFLEKNTNFFYR